MPNLITTFQDADGNVVALAESKQQTLDLTVKNVSKPVNFIWKKLKTESPNVFEQMCTVWTPEQIYMAVPKFVGAWCINQFKLDTDEAREVVIQIRTKLRNEQRKYRIAQSKIVDTTVENAATTELATAEQLLNA